MWTYQYVHLSPTTCFALDDGTGRVVGYCIGCADIPSFCASYGDYVRDVLDPSDEIDRPASLTAREPWLLADGRINGVCLAQQAYSPDLLLLDGCAGRLARGLRATMHIDLLPEWQGKGWGKKLIGKLVDAVRTSPEQQGRGIWLGVAGDNTKVVPFYERMGFRVDEEEMKGKGEGGGVPMFYEF